MLNPIEVSDFQGVPLALITRLLSLCLLTFFACEITELDYRRAEPLGGCTAAVSRLLLGRALAAKRKGCPTFRAASSSIRSSWSSRRCTSAQGPHVFPKTSALDFYGRIFEDAACPLHELLLGDVD